MIDNYNKLTYRQIHEQLLPNRSIESIRSYAVKKLKLKKDISACRGWTQENIEILRLYYPSMPTTFIQQKYLPQFSEKKIMEYASIIGLSKDSHYVKNWSEQEISLLKNNYSHSTMEELLLLLPQKSNNKIRHMARALGLKKDSDTYRTIMNQNNEKSLICSKPQALVDDMLKQCGIQYVREYNINYYHVDNYLPDYNLMIEVQGDYWHQSPLLEANVQFKDKNVRIKDKAKHTYVKNHYNLEILYLWESDINNNPTKCIELIKQYIANSGALPNYHSFNYDYIDGSLTLNSDVINIGY